MFFRQIRIFAHAHGGGAEKPFSKLSRQHEQYTHRERESRPKMWWNRLLDALLALLMIVGGTLVVLLRVALIAITHPLTAFKKTKRESKPAWLAR